MADIDAIAKEVNTIFGEGTLLRASEAKSLTMDWLKTGIFDLDIKLGGGLPRGRIITYKVGYSTGKSVVAMCNVAQAQSTCRYCGQLFEHIDLQGVYHAYDCRCKKKEPMRCVWLDAENSYDPEWAEQWNVDNSVLYVIRTEYAEQAIDVIDRCIMLRSNPGETVFTPFMGVGSEVYGAVIAGRRGVGVELKTSYYNQAIQNLEAAEGDTTYRANEQVSLFGDDL
jgi:RecA/RadA recombinase